MYISVLKYSNNWHDIFPEELRQIGKRQAKDIMDEQHYCMDEANVKCYIDETEERSEWRVIICVQWTLGSRKTERRRRRIRSCVSVCLSWWNDLWFYLVSLAILLNYHLMESHTFPPLQSLPAVWFSCIVCDISVVVLEEVLVLVDFPGPIYESLFLSSDFKSLSLSWSLNSLSLSWSLNSLSLSSDLKFLTTSLSDIH